MTETTPLTPAARRAYETTILPLTDSLRGRALTLTRNASEADDLVQDTLIRAYRGWHTYDADRNTAKAWLYTVLRNTFRNRYAAVNRRRDVQSTARAEGVTNMGSVPGAAEAIEAADLAAVVRGAVDALPADYAAVVRAVDLEGASYAAAAEALGCPQGTVMSRLYRARKRLAVTLSEAA